MLQTRYHESYYQTKLVAPPLVANLEMGKGLSASLGCILWLVGIILRNKTTFNDLLIDKLVFCKFVISLEDKGIVSRKRVRPLSALG